MTRKLFYWCPIRSYNNIRIHKEIWIVLQIGIVARRQCQKVFLCAYAEGIALGTWLVTKHKNAEVLDEVATVGVNLDQRIGMSQQRYIVARNLQVAAFRIPSHTVCSAYSKVGPDGSNAVGRVQSHRCRGENCSIGACYSRRTRIQACCFCPVGIAE